MKKLLYVLVCLVVIGLCVPALCSADDSGTCGEHVTWTYSSADGVLTISGSGAMMDHGYGSLPWYSFRYCYRDSEAESYGNRNGIHVELMDGTGPVH